MVMPVLTGYMFRGAEVLNITYLYVNYLLTGAISVMFELIGWPVRKGPIRNLVT